MMPTRFSPAVRGACLAAALAIVAVILYESTQERGRPGVPDLTTNEAYLGHFAIYAVLTFCSIAALGPRTFSAVIALVLFAVGLGVALEFYQAQLATRTSSSGDVLANTAGVLFGVFSYVLLVLLLEEPKQGQPTKS